MRFGGRALGQVNLFEVLVKEIVFKSRFAGSGGAREASLLVFSPIKFKYKYVLSSVLGYCMFCCVGMCVCVCVCVCVLVLFIV